MQRRLQGENKEPAGSLWGGPKAAAVESGCGIREEGNLQRWKSGMGPG